jgi:phosphomannomutase/phosphoglucomutase
MIKLAPRKKAAKKATGKPRPLRGATLFSYWMTAFVGIALTLTTAIGVPVYLQRESEGHEQAEAVAAQSRVLAARLTQTLALYRQMLQGLVADPALPPLLADVDALAQREKTLTVLLPDTLQVRLLPIGHDQLLPDATPPFSYAALALLRAAERANDPPPLELHLAQAPQPYLAGAARLAGGGGVLYVAWEAIPLRHWITAIPAEFGRVELQQEVEGRFATLYANAAAGVARAPDVVLPIPGSLLRIAHWYGPGPLSRAGAEPGMVALLLALALSAGLMWLQYWRLRKALNADQAALVHLVEDVLAGQEPRRLRVRIRDYSYMAKLLSQRLTTLREQSPRGPKVAREERKARTAKQSVPEPARREPQASPPDDLLGELPDVIFRPYDIRGVVGNTLTVSVMREIGRAIGSEAHDQGQQTLAVARDARESGVELSKALMAGINATGRDVIDLGMVPVPVLYFATHYLGSNSGVMVTGSHNPPEYNGLKVVIDGETLAGPRIRSLRERVERGELLEGAGASHAQDLVPDYLERVTQDVSVARPLKVVIDCGNGCTALVAPRLYKALGCEVVELHCELKDPPDHHPDPSRPENLQDLGRSVVAERADLGLAFDGDGDRLGVVDSRGHIIWPDRVLMLLAADVLSRNPGGDVVFDVKCSRSLASQILQYGGRPVMWKSGHSLIKAKLRETGALLAGEWTGHIMFRERWYGFDDALYAGARLLEILSMDQRSSAKIFADYPEAIATPELFLPLAEGAQYELMDRLQRHSELLVGAKLTTVDGLRAESEDGWGLVRASNTAPALSFRFEADSEQALDRIQDLYRQLLGAVAPEVKPPF